MTDRQVDYDQIAGTFDRRYQAGDYAGTAAALRSLARESAGGRVLEVGCGTGRWLAEARPLVAQVFGLDRSPGMLARARQQRAPAHLVCGRAGRLPFAGAAFDLVFCINALHHFAHPRRFVAEARRLLAAGGALAVVGMDPHAGRDRWYLYDYFEGTREIDLARFPSRATIAEWMHTAGFERVEWRLAEHVVHQFRGRDVLEDYFLQKDSTSQLTLLSDEVYAAGLARIEAALARSEAAGETLVFPVDLSIALAIGRAPGEAN